MELLFKQVALFNANAASVTSETDVIRADSGRPLRYRMRISVLGYLEGSGQADLTAKEVTHPKHPLERLRRPLTRPGYGRSLGADDPQQLLDHRRGD